jgi:hypothetical protein
VNNQLKTMSVRAVGCAREVMAVNPAFAVHDSREDQENVTSVPSFA